MPTATCSREASALVGDRLAAACDMIESFRDYRTPITGRRAAAISTMIADIAAAATAASDEKHTSSSTTARRKEKTRMGGMDSSNWYKEVSRLGKGHFGVVSKARHRATGHVVAIKSLRPKRRCGGGDDEDEGDYDLLREACFMAACRGHPSLVGLHTVLRAPVTGDYCLAMDYVGPTTLVDVMSLARHGEADVRRMMRQLLEGADAMHRRGIVHRDIKPGNILVSDVHGDLKICDLGLATYVGERDPPYVNTGTLPYMAPEVLVGSSMDPDHDDTLVDSWSLGCVMAQLLLGGHVLFKGKSTSDQLYKIFDVLGVPGKKAWQSLKPSSCRLADEVRQWRTRQQRVGHHRSCNRLRSMFPEEVLSKDGFEVLSGLLTCNTRRRLTAAAALRCRWFTADNVVDVVDGDDDPLVPAAPAVSEVGDTPTTTVWSQVVAGVRRVLGLLRPKGLFNSIIGLSIGT